LVSSKNPPEGTRSRGPLVAGVVRNSFVDWPGKIAFVVFLGGCNFKCPHCHNHGILCASSNTIPLNTVLDEIRAQFDPKTKKPFIDGVVISGGEPTVHPNLLEIITEVRKLGLPIKLDTNGSDFVLLEKLVTQKLVDFVAMDIKAPLSKYTSLGFVKSLSAVDNIVRSIEFLKTYKRRGFAHMFRTTPIPQLSSADIGEVRAMADKTWVLNDFVPQNKC